MSQNGTPPVVSIETAKKKVVGTMRIDGTEYEVLQLTFGQNQRLTARDSADRYVATVYDIIGEVMPTLPPETRANVALPDGEIIILFAGAGAKAVEASFPNAVTPADPISAA